MPRASRNRPDQAAAIPVRFRRRKVQVCVIRRRGGKSWGIPKGLIDRGDTAEETALNESWEEAGLTGRVLGRALGTYQYQKWDRTLTVAVYLMEVEAQERTWEEASFRERKWIVFDDADAYLKRHPARSLLERAWRRLRRSKPRLGRD